MLAQNAPVCPAPPEGLRQGDPNVQARKAAISESGVVYQLDVLSGFAPQNNQTGGQFCIRYELINNANADILALNWPDAGLKTRNLAPGINNRVSWIKTIGTSQPSVKPTQIHSFKSSTVPSEGYFAGAIPGENRNVRLVAYKLDEIELAQSTPGADNTVPDPPQVGGTLSVGNATVDVGSSLKRDSQGFQIDISISRNSNDAVTAIKAPWVSALAAKPAVEEYAAMADKLQGENLELVENKYSVSVRYPPQSDPGENVVLEQPITISHGGTETCITVPIYSPVRISPIASLRCE